MIKQVHSLNTVKSKHNTCEPGRYLSHRSCILRSLISSQYI